MSLVPKGIADSRRASFCFFAVVHIAVFEDEGVPPHLLHSDSSLRVDLEKTPNQVFGFDAKKLGHGIFSASNQVEHRVMIMVVKWKAAGKHSVKDAAKTPYVCLVPFVRPVTEELGSSVVRTTAGRFQIVRFMLMQSRHTKVGYLDASPLRDENVLGFEIPMTDVKRVAI